ncbi:MAG: PaaI family thioesterase [Negativicutes bacterium]|nr:PaaI family thioesterase [Negativicutes bacterium]
MEKYDPYAWCFACGQQNPIGLKLQFAETEEQEYIARFTADARHQGYPGVVHGGIISTLLDEAMARYVYAKGWYAVTARIEIKFLQPTPVGSCLTIGGRITKTRGKLFETAADIRLDDGTVTAEATGKIVVTGRLGEKFPV